MSGLWGRERGISMKFVVKLIFICLGSLSPGVSMGAINTLADDYFTHLRMRPPKFRHIEDAGRWFADRDRLQHQAAFNVATQIWQDASVAENQPVEA